MNTITLSEECFLLISGTLLLLFYSTNKCWDREDKVPTLSCTIFIITIHWQNRNSVPPYISRIIILLFHKLCYSFFIQLIYAGIGGTEFRLCQTLFVKCTILWQNRNSVLPYISRIIILLFHKLCYSLFNSTHSCWDREDRVPTLS